VLATLHSDARGRPRVLFLVNPTEWAHECSVKLPGVARVADALDGSTIEVNRGAFRLVVGGRSVRMLELEGRAASRS